MTEQTPTAEMEKWLRIRVRFFPNFDSGSERKTQNPAGVDFGTPGPVPAQTVVIISAIVLVQCSL